MWEAIFINEERGWYVRQKVEGPTANPYRTHMSPMTPTVLHVQLTKDEAEAIVEALNSLIW